MAEREANAKSSADCCPQGSLPALSDAYNARGSDETLGDLPLYTVGAEDAKHAVIVSYDIYGFNGGRIRNICDQIANCGYRVVLPDFFRGDCWTTERNTTEPDEKWPWIKSVSSPDAVHTDLVAVIGMLKSNGMQRIGMVGFCFGGYAALIGSKTATLACIVGVHASWKIFNFHGSNELEEADKCTCPVMLLQAENDPPNTKPGGEIEGVLNTKPFADDCVLKSFDEMAHGWVPRGDLTDPTVNRDVELAMDMIKTFLDRHVRDAPIKCPCPCAVCTCADWKCAPGDAGCDPCGSFQATMKEAAENKL
jgi:dienelactone hydrolase